ncbi:hypothetical protein D3C81_1999390 [compost metagenome]
MEGVAGLGKNGPRERAAKNDLARFQRHVVLRQLVGQPHDAVGGVVQHARRQAGFLDDGIARHHRADPAQVHVAHAHGAAAHHHARVGGVVGDGVEHLARAF